MTSTTTPGPGFVAVADADRIATFDNDGTLWAEITIISCNHRFAVAPGGDPHRASQDLLQMVRRGVAITLKRSGSFPYCGTFLVWPTQIDE